MVTYDEEKINIHLEDMRNRDVHERPEFAEYFINIAWQVMQRATCLRRRWGAVLVKDHRIVSTGYNGIQSGHQDCLERDECMRKKQDVPSGEQVEKCYAIHAEENCLLQALNRGHDVYDSTVYLTGYDVIKDDIATALGPCKQCSQRLINCGVSRCYLYTYPNSESDEPELFWITPKESFHERCKQLDLNPPSVDYK